RVRPLPDGVGPRFGDRDARVAHLRVHCAARPAARLGPSNLLGSRTDLGYGRHPASGRGWRRARRYRAVPRTGRRVLAHRGLGLRPPAGLGPAQRVVGSHMRSAVRLFLVGGLVSYRALFNWLNPWILVPTFVLSPLFQILLFVYIGRTAAVGSDEFFLIGNAVQYAAIPCLFAMGSTIAGERQWGTLP